MSALSSSEAVDVGGGVAVAAAATTAAANADANNGDAKQMDPLKIKTRAFGMCAPCVYVEH